MSSQHTLTSATFAWANVPNMTTCGPATISWVYTGPSQGLMLGTESSPNLSFAVNATLQSYTVPAVRLSPGEYIMTVITTDESMDIPNRTAPFFVDGSNTSCLVAQSVSSRDNSSYTDGTEPSSSSSSSSKKAAMFGGIAVGIGGFVALVASGFYFRWDTVWKRFRRRSKEKRPEAPGYDVRWDNASCDPSMTGSVSEHNLLPPRTIGTPEMRMIPSNGSSGDLPRLEPNRRPPSTVLGWPESNASTPEPLPPLPPPRLEPNRRKPSIAALASQDARSTKPVPPVPPLPTQAPSHPHRSPEAQRLDLEDEFKPLAAPRPTPIPAPILLSIPKPPYRHATARQSGASAFTSVSTALSDMSLLKPAGRVPPSEPALTEEVEEQRALALVRLGAVMDSASRLTSSPELPSQSPSPSPSDATARVRVPVAQDPVAPHSSRTHTGAAVRTPTSPRIQAIRQQAFTSSLVRSGSTGSTRTNRSSRSARKPVPPLDPADEYGSGTGSGTGTSVGISDLELWSTTRRSSYEGSTLTWAGSPVPSSSTSEMYRIRDSAWSEWTWTRPLENWEREQLKVLASVNMADEAGPVPNMPGKPAEGMAPPMPLLVSKPSSPHPLPASGGGRKSSSSLRHQNFGEMKTMRRILPDAPLPSDSRRG
ncbi:hypothetical protein C8Q80DRAFT_825022 [Daedaleopsis nitida]|nr:hypothetical protein C8Q80DRAFT_825022 [Daedaleopsis nitida]